ncbi:MAG TPA: ParB/RepB/Spo0J family partition protein [Phycisphaerae bacterium]|nr:ParB/RepB/Spo0J family partition protein [Phycisphaerae bacterium]HPS52505.1 ParB/RepB/Spo0J family partition protein [Phycisphaerae bacterium]
MEHKTAGSRLGRGLDALMGEADSFTAAETTHHGETQTEHKPQEIHISLIAPNPNQPRQNFDEIQLEELAKSIRQEGILQPLVITESQNITSFKTDKPYVLIAGERRLRAAHLAGLENVPVIFRNADDRKLIEWAMIENIQREELNPIERAHAYRDYMDRFQLTQQEVAEKLGQARATVANFLRMIDLCDDVQTLVASGQVSFGHAKVIAGIAGNPELQAKLAHKVVSEGMSVRKLEEIIENSKENFSDENNRKKSPQKPAYVMDMEQQLTESVGTKVQILPGRAKNSGKIILEYYSLDDFDKIAGLLGLQPEEI